MNLPDEQTEAGPFVLLFRTPGPFPLLGFRISPAAPDASALRCCARLFGRHE